MFVCPVARHRACIFGTAVTARNEVGYRRGSHVAIVMKRMAASVLPLLLASLACGAVPPRPHLVRRASAAQVRPTVTARPATGPRPDDRF